MKKTVTVAVVVALVLSILFAVPVSAASKKGCTGNRIDGLVMGGTGCPIAFEIKDSLKSFYTKPLLL